MRLPLEDIRIVSVEQFGAGPWGTLQLADLGAEIVKISAYYPGPSLDVLPVDPHPEVAIAAFAIADLSKSGRASAAGPARLQVAESRKMPASVLSPQIKIAAAYTHAAIAKARAKAAGFHDVLFLDELDRLRVQTDAHSRAVVSEIERLRNQAEVDHEIEAPLGWETLKSRRYGRTWVTQLQRVA